MTQEKSKEKCFTYTGNQDTDDFLADNEACTILFSNSPEDFADCANVTAFRRETEGKVDYKYMLLIDKTY